MRISALNSCYFFKQNTSKSKVKIPEHLQTHSKRSKWTRPWSTEPQHSDLVHYQKKQLKSNPDELKLLSSFILLHIAVQFYHKITATICQDITPDHKCCTAQNCNFQLWAIICYTPPSTHHCSMSLAGCQTTSAFHNTPCPAHNSAYQYQDTIMDIIV